MAKHLPFYATRADLVDALLAAESAGDFKYVYVSFLESESDHGRSFDSAYELPLGDSPTGDCLTDPKFLIVPDGLEVRSRSTATRRMIIDESANPAAVLLRPGGRYSNNCLISGEFATLAQQPGARVLFERLSEAVRRRFEDVGAYAVGPEAHKLLVKGARLTPGVNRPRAQDLSVDWLR